jgi:hippurate hydrolase
MDEHLFSELDPMQSELVAILHDIHSHPELAMEEVRTSKLVAEKLQEYGLTVTEGVGRYGVVGTLKSTIPGDHSIALRAEMDALQLTEETNLPYSSKISAVMHACGHDGHTVMLLGSAKYLSEHRDSFCGTVYFIFQPAEEKFQGAMAMINDQLFQRFPVDAIYALHNSPSIALGKFVIRSGPMMAASDRWYVTFHGTGGHGGAYPHLATDVTILQAQFILALQTIVSRNIASTDSAVISIGAVEGGSFNSLNVMPSQIRIGGTSRSFTKPVRDTIERRIKELAHGLAESFGCTAQIEYYRFGTALVNHDQQTSKAVQAAELLVGKNNVNGNAPPFTSADDFAYMLEEKAGAYMCMGNGITGSPVHSPTYIFDDRSIPFGVGFWIRLVQLELKS